MTTTITLETHNWPTKIITRDDHESECGTYKHHGVTEEVVPPNSKRVVHVTSTRSIEFVEMPIPPADAE
ncbi:MAG TPA: hypothetical protein VJM09_12040 [Sphingobium sp.]|nr:hypothetical protein [Sphingobium sp.]